MFGYKLEYRFKRLRVRWRKLFNKLDKNLTPDRGDKLTSYEEKAIRLWRILLRDNDTKLSYNSVGIRQIEKGQILMIFQPLNSIDYCLTLMDITEERRSLYELHIPNKYAEVAVDNFDDELNRRMRKAELAKRNVIENDIDKILEEEEKILLEKINSRR